MDFRQKLYKKKNIMYILNFDTNKLNRFATRIQNYSWINNIKYIIIYPVIIYVNNIVWILSIPIGIRYSLI